MNCGVKLMLVVLLMTKASEGIELAKEIEQFRPAETIESIVLSKTSDTFFSKTYISRYWNSDAKVWVITKEQLSDDVRKLILCMSPLHWECRNGGEADLADRLSKNKHISDLLDTSKAADMEAKRKNYGRIEAAYLNLYECERDLFIRARKRFVENRDDSALRVVELLLRRGSDLEVTDIFGRTSMHVAAANGKHQAMKLLLDNGAKVNPSDKYGRRPLHIASLEGHLQIVKDLLNYKDLSMRSVVLSSINVPCLTTRQTALHLSAVNNQFEVANLLLEKGAKRDEIDGFGRTPLFHASKYGHIAVVQGLLEKGANNAQKDIIGMSPLCIAVANGHLDAVKLLRGASPNIADLNLVALDGETPIFKAVRNGQPDISRHAATVELLYNLRDAKNERFLIFLLFERNKKGQWERVNKKGQTPLHLAAASGHCEIVSILLRAGLNVNKPDNDGQTPLQLAAANGHVEVIRQLLVVRDIEVNKVDKNSLSALHLAASNGRSGVVKLLLGDEHREVNALNNKNQTPLHMAAANGHCEVVELLLQARANVKLVDHQGQTSLHVAAADGYLGIVKLLVNAGASVEAEDKKGQTALHLLARRIGYPRNFKRILRRIDERNRIDKNVAIAFFWKLYSSDARKNQLEVIRLLLSKGANKQAVNSKMQTPLDVAIFKGNYEIVELLLLAATPMFDEVSAAVPLETHSRRLEEAERRAQAALARLAQSGEVDVNDWARKRGNSFEKMLEAWKWDENRVKVAEFLLAKGACVNACDKEGFRPLSWACYNGSAELVRLLLENNAAVDVLEAQTPLHFAAETSHTDVIELLKSALRDLNIDFNRLSFYHGRPI